MIKIFIFILLIFFTVIGFAQSIADTTYITEDKNTSSLTIVKDNRIDKLNDVYKESYKLIGYRIQIYSGNKRSPAREARMRFIKLYNTIKAHENYEQPYFKVRVGDFKSKIEALKFKKEFEKHFPNCIIIKDEIEF